MFGFSLLSPIGDSVTSSIQCCISALVQHADMLSLPHLGVAGAKLSPVSSEGPSAAAGPPGSNKPWTARHRSPSLSSRSAWVSNTNRQRQERMPTKPGLHGLDHLRDLHQWWKIQLQRLQQTHHQRKLGNRHPPARTQPQAQVLHPSMSLQGCSGAVGQANDFPQSQCIMACPSIPAPCLCCTLHLLQHQQHQHRKQKCWTPLMRSYQACSKSCSMYADLRLSSVA